VFKGEGVKCFQNLATPTPAPAPSCRTAGPSHQPDVYRSPHFQATPSLDIYHHQQQPPNHNSSQHYNYHQTPQQQDSFEHEKQETPTFSIQDSLFSYNGDTDEEQNRQIVEDFNQVYEESQENYGAMYQPRSCDDSEDPHKGTAMPNFGVILDSELEAADGHYNEDHFVGSFGLSTPGFDQKLVLGESEEDQEGEREEGEEESGAFGASGRKRHWSGDLRGEDDDEAGSGIARKRLKIDQERSGYAAAMDTDGLEMGRLADPEAEDGDVAGSGGEERLRPSRGSSGDIEEGEVSDDESEELKSKVLKTPDAEGSASPEPQVSYVGNTDSSSNVCSFIDDA